MFNPERLSLIVQPVGDGGIRFFGYQTDDVEATVTGAGYATNAADYGIRTYDLIFVSPLSGAVDTYILAVDTIDADGHATLRAEVGAPSITRYATLSDAQSANVPASANAVELLYYATVGDGGGARYVRVGSEPGHPGKFQSADGAWWEIVVQNGIDIRWFGGIPDDLSTPAASVANRATAIRNAFALAEFLGGGEVLFPAGKIAGDGTRIDIPDNVSIKGPGRDICHFVESGSLPATVNAFVNKNYSILNGSLGAPGIRVSGITFDGSLRVFPAWLSKADGTPVNNPEADYRVGGALAPTVISTVSLTVAAGAITALTINTAGSGYVYPPTLWITGDGSGAIISLTIAAGAVTGYTIVAGGTGYTSATGEVAGGGADPLTALYAADRRNQLYSQRGAVFEFVKATNPIVEDCGFINHGGTSVSDLGSDLATVRRNHFENCGQSDFASACLFTTGHGSNVQVYHRPGTRPIFENNTCKDLNRLALFCNSEDGHVVGNKVDGFKEAGFIFGAASTDPVIDRNDVRGGRISDITCLAIESHAALRLTNNTFADIDGQAIGQFGNYIEESGSLFEAIDNAARVLTIPFGPFSERVGFNEGSAAIAGTQRDPSVRELVSLIYKDAVPQRVRMGPNRIVDATGAYDLFLGVQGNNPPLRGECILREIDILDAPGIAMFDPVAVDDNLKSSGFLRVIDCPGHASMGPVGVQQTVLAGASGTLKFTFGFRPRKVTVMGRRTTGAQINHTLGIYIDQRSNPNNSGFRMRWAVNGTTSVAASDNTGGLVISDTGGTVFSAGAIGFSSDGWSINVTVSTQDVILQVIGEP